MTTVFQIEPVNSADKGTFFHKSDISTISTPKFDTSNGHKNNNEFYGKCTRNMATVGR